MILKFLHSNLGVVDMTSPQFSLDLLSSIGPNAEMLNLRIYLGSTKLRMKRLTALSVSLAVVVCRVPSWMTTL